MKILAKFTFKGGIHIHGANKKKKLTTTAPVSEFTAAKLVYLPLGQQLGKPSIPVATIGDTVKVGQLIAKGDGVFSSNLHASVSGTIQKIENHPEPTGNVSPTIIIENDEKNQWISLTETPRGTDLTREAIVKKIAEAGIVGLGGATFPTPVKYTSDKPCDTVLLNGIECEPYNTADYITMKNHPDEIIQGLVYLVKAANAKKGVICIEDNKMDIYNTFIEKTNSFENIFVALFKEKYPQGAEKQMIYALTKKEVPYSGLPIDIGVIVNNVGTAKAVCDAIEKGKPLTHHYVTVTGGALKTPQSFIIPIGTPFKDLIDACGGGLDNQVLLAGGLMMGKAMYSEMVPVTKGINAIILLKDFPKKTKEMNCVRCSACVDKCPAFLEPTTLATLVKKGKVDELENNGLSACIECGSCSYVCPSAIPLLDYIRQGKIELRRRKK